MNLTPPLRLATAADARELAELVNFAGEGLPYYLWSQMAKGEQNPWEIGFERQAAKAEAGQIYVVDEGEGAVAGLTGYTIGSEPETIGPDTPALFKPLLELENRAPMTWYVNVLACYPNHRGKGYGTKLLALAEDLARAAERARMSLIVADTNTGARRLYVRAGYQEIATAPCVREGWQTHTRNWVLLTKDL